jgi:hypothetical protein
METKGTHRRSTKARSARLLPRVALVLCASSLGFSASASGQVDLPGGTDDQVRGLVPKVEIPKQAPSLGGSGPSTQSAPPTQSRPTTPQGSPSAHAAPSGSQPRGAHAANSGGGGSGPAAQAGGGSSGGDSAKPGTSSNGDDLSGGGRAGDRSSGNGAGDDESASEDGATGDVEAIDDAGNPVSRTAGFLAEHLPFTGRQVVGLPLLGAVLAALGLTLRRRLSSPG